MMDVEESDDDDGVVELAPVQISARLINRPVSLDHLKKMNADFLARTCKKNRTNPGTILLKDCCEAECTLLLSRAAIMRVRSNVMDIWKDHTKVTDIRKIIRLLVGPVTKVSDTELSGTFLVDGVEVCAEVYSAILGLTTESLLALMLDSTVIDNGTTIEHGLIGRVMLHDHTIRNIVSAAYFIESHCQSNPSGGLLMPAGLTKSQFIRIVAPSSQFRLSTLRKYLKKSIFFRSLDSHLRCNTCQHLGKAAKPNCEWDVDDIRTGLELRKQHFKEMLCDRLTIEMAETVSRNEPWSLLLVKLDGMGKHSTKLPHLVLRAKHISDVSRSPYELFASQFARHTTNNTMFTNIMFGSLFDGYKGGTSTYVSHFLHALTKVDIIPPVLIIVLDNARPNKSEEMFCFIGWMLLRFPTLEKVYLVFQSVGHTHNSVDAVFGNIAQKLTTVEAESPSKMDTLVSELSGVTEFLRNSDVYNFQPLTNFAEEYVNRLSQQHFVVFKDEKGEVRFKCSRFIRCSQYFRLENTDEEESVFPVFKKHAEKQVSMFTPEVVATNYANIIAGCESIIKSSKGFLSDSDIQEYQSIIQECNKPSAPVSIKEVIRQVEVKMKAPVTVASQGQAHVDALLQFLKRMHMMDEDTWKPLRYKKKPRTD